MKRNAKFYTPSDNDIQEWLIVFEDSDMPNQVFSTEHAAIDAFKDYDMTWNITLFATVPVGNKIK